MNVDQHRDYPWLVMEKGLIAEVIGLGKPVLGICLGAQLIADAMGGRVYQNAEYEIGWYPVRMVEGAREHRLFAHFPKELKVLHWHGDTFDLPAGAALLGSSEACRHQVFVCGEKIVGLQFHPEVRAEDVRFFVQGETGPLPEGKYVQSFEEILGGDSNIPAVHEALRGVLDAMAATAE